MPKSDWFARKAEAVCREYRTSDLLIRPLLVKHFRAEHRAVVRLVKNLRGKAGLRTQYQKGRQVDSPMTSYTLACDDLLAALARRMK